VTIKLFDKTDNAFFTFTVRKDVCRVDVKTRGDIYSIFNGIYKKKNKNITQGSASELKKQKLEEKIKPFLPVSETLYDIVSKHLDIKINKNHIKTWAVEIERLMSIDKISIKRMEKVLDWYEKNIGGQYVPVIHAGPSFRKKFVSLEQAMFRSLRKEPSKFEWHNDIKYRRGEDNRLYHARTGTLYKP
jgi:hypothetical protein